MNNDGMIELAERAKDEGRSLLDGVIRQGAQKILQAALELEIEEHLAALGVGADGQEQPRGSDMVYCNFTAPNTVP